MILGLLEARLLSFDRVLLAGLDETVRPPAVDTDAFSTRPMRAALGLSAPERRIGQTAHDFVAALGAREAILSSGEEARRPADCRLSLSAADGGCGWSPGDRGAGRARRALSHVCARTRPTDRFPAAAETAPRPAGELRPKALSVTRIETLRRDPYAIYAEYILAIEGARDCRARDRAARNGNGLARSAAEVCRGLSVRRSPTRGA